MEKNNDARNRNKYFSPKLIMLLLLFAFPFIVIAGGTQSSTDADTVMSMYSNRTFSFDLELFFGLGTKNLTVGKTTDNTDVTMSGGGGIGGLLTVMYNVNPSLELCLSFGSQSSSLSPKVDNADGSFPRQMFLVTLKYDVPITPAELLKFGGGIGYYMPGDLDLDLSKVTSGGHNVYSYDSNIGFHITADFERLISPNWSWGLGIKYYNVSYDLKSARLSGTNVQLNSLSSAIKDEVGKLDGGTFNLSVFIAYHLY